MTVDNPAPGLTRTLCFNCETRHFASKRLIAWHIATGMLALALVFASSAVFAGGGREDWRAALLACLDFVESGNAEGLEASGWTPTAVGRKDTYRHPRGAEISVRDPLKRPVAVDWVCSLSYATKIAGNDRRGQVLRETLLELAERRLIFRDEDQISPSDVYRGCAWDGQEFRLSSMTQTTYAHFTIQLSPRDPQCAAWTS